MARRLDAVRGQNPTHPSEKSKTRKKDEKENDEVSKRRGCGLPPRPLLQAIRASLEEEIAAAAVDRDNNGGARIRSAARCPRQSPRSRLSFFSMLSQPPSFSSASASTSTSSSYPSPAPSPSSGHGRCALISSCSSYSSPSPSPLPPSSSPSSLPSSSSLPSPSSSSHRWLLERDNEATEFFNDGLARYFRGVDDGCGCGCESGAVDCLGDAGLARLHLSRAVEIRREMEKHVDAQAFLDEVYDEGERGRDGGRTRRQKHERQSRHALLLLLEMARPCDTVDEGENKKETAAIPKTTKKEMYATKYHDEPPGVTTPAAATADVISPEQIEIVIPTARRRRRGRHAKEDRSEADQQDDGIDNVSSLSLSAASAAYSSSFSSSVVSGFWDTASRLDDADWYDSWVASTDVAAPAAAAAAAHHGGGGTQREVEAVEVVAATTTRTITRQLVNMSLHSASYTPATKQGIRSAETGEGKVLLPRNEHPAVMATSAGTDRRR